MDKINKKLNIPNKLTIFRFIIAFLIMILFVLELDFKFLIILSLFSTGVITDALDGYLARNYFEITTFGKLMDPLADKVLLVVVLIGLVEFEMLKGWMVACIFAREFMITGLRLLLVSDNQIISANIWGKIKNNYSDGICFVTIMWFSLSKYFIFSNSKFCLCFLSGRNNGFCNII